MLFDTEGFLLVGMGDGGGGNDTFRTAQNPNSLLGKILRLDVERPRRSRDAPLELREDAGTRLPHSSRQPVRGRHSDPRGQKSGHSASVTRGASRFAPPALGGTGALLIGDVGQNAREEVDYEPAGPRRPELRLADA